MLSESNFVVVFAFSDGRWHTYWKKATKTFYLHMLTRAKWHATKPSSAEVLLLTQFFINEQKQQNRKALGIFNFAV